MKLSKKSRYGLRALIDLAVNFADGPVALSSIAERSGISQQNLEQVFASLKKAGIVNSVKGPQGGYTLARLTNEIMVAEIIEALEGDYLTSAEEIPKESSYAAASAVIQELIIDRVNSQLVSLLKEITMADLVESYQSRSEFAENMYYI